MEDLTGHTYPAVGRCIYCCSTEGKLGKEHIIPLGLGGTLILPKASCQKCERLTCKLEGIIQRAMLGKFRIALGLPTRRPKERPGELEIHLIKNGHVVRQNIPASELPLAYVAMKLPPPRVTQGLPHTDKLDYEVAAFFTDAVKSKYMSQHGEGVLLGHIDPFVFLRFLAKIAHAFAVAKLGLNAFRPLLPDIILGKSDVLTAELFQLIGGGPDLPCEPHPGPGTLSLHRLQVHRNDAMGANYLIVSIRLFCFLNAPTYYVVVGLDQSDESSS